MTDQRPPDADQKPSLSLLGCANGLSSLDDILAMFIRLMGKAMPMIAVFPLRWGVLFWFTGTLTLGSFGSLNRVAAKNAVTLSVHPHRVLSIAFSPDGKVLASGNDDGTICLWDVAAAKLRATLNSPSRRIDCLAFSPKGQVLASCGYDYDIQLWDLGKGKRLTSLKGHTSAVNCLAYSPDGETIASGGNRGEVKIWKIRERKELGTFRPHPGAVYSVSFAPDGRTLVSATTAYEIGQEPVKGKRSVFRDFIKNTDSKIIMWDTKTMREQTPRPDARRDLLYYQLAYSPDGRTLAAGASDHTVKLWDFGTGRIRAVLKGHDAQVYSVAWSTDGKSLASGGVDAVIRLWDMPTGKLRLALNDHSDVVNSVAFSPDGTRMASGSSDGTVKLWDVTELLRGGAK
jgi:WD40 repeat protein